MTILDRKLARIADFITAGVTARTAAEIMELLCLPGLSAQELSEARLYPEYLPAGTNAFTEETRCLHFLWDSLDRSPLCSAVNFAIPLRRLIAGKLFKKCGADFTCERNVRFNFGPNIEVGDNVFFNEGVFLDSKGGIQIGNHSALAEFVVVFTHNHNESRHAQRTYAPVVIGDYCKIYTHAMLLPGITVRRQGIVAACALVAHDVPENTLVAGIPARAVRPRETCGRNGAELEHVWLSPGSFSEQAGS